MDKKKALGLIFLLVIVGSIYPGVLFYLENTYGALGNISVMDYYVPWIFHLLLIQMVFFVGILVFGFWILLSLGGDEEPEQLEKRYIEQPKKQLIAQKISEQQVQEPGKKVFFVNEGMEPADDEEMIQVPPEWREREYE